MNRAHQHYDVIIIGGGAAGLMAARQAGRRGKKVLLIEHSAKIGEKIRISGGGRCNFTNLHIDSSNYLSQNPHFIKSALASYSQHDFIALIESHGIQYHEKTLGQLFCNGSAVQIIELFLQDCKKAKVDIKTLCSVTAINKNHLYYLETNQGHFSSTALIIATGGLSIPKIGASDFGYKIAKQFGLKLISTQPALVPLTAHHDQRDFYTQLSGLSLPCVVSYKKTHFKENLLFTHLGLSGPAILQISSYLDRFQDEKININLLPTLDLSLELTAHKNSKNTIAYHLKPLLPKRLIDALSLNHDLNTPLTDMKKSNILHTAKQLHTFSTTLGGSSGYQKAEVTKGGLSTHELSSKTMECKRVPHLYFIGEVVDVTGWLGGYNFQWAWSSGYLAGNNC